MMQRAYAKLKEKAGGGQNLNELSLAGEDRSPSCASGQGTDTETL